jgi:hypothetical protein
MWYGLINRVVKYQIIVDSVISMISKWKTSNLESTIQKSRGLLILPRWSKVIHGGNRVKFSLISWLLQYTVLDVCENELPGTEGYTSLDCHLDDNIWHGLLGKWTSLLWGLHSSFCPVNIATINPHF